MSGRLREIARETVAIAESGRYGHSSGTEKVVAESVRAAPAGTRLYLPGEHLGDSQADRGAPAVEVTHESTLMAARRMGPQVACPVFASAKNPGGGFLTAAAPNLGAILRNQPEHAADVPGVLARRARRILQIAAGYGYRKLVLGAWGCGVFRNDPVTALQAIKGFDRVVFAVYDGQAGTPVFRAFAQHFQDNGSQ